MKYLSHTKVAHRSSVLGRTLSPASWVIALCRHTLTLSETMPTRANLSFIHVLVRSDDVPYPKPAYSANQLQVSASPLTSRIVYERKP